MVVDDGIVIGDTLRVLCRGEIATVINRMNAIEVCMFVFPLFCLCGLAETLFQRMEGSFQVDWKSLRQSILLGSSCWKSSRQARGD